MHVVLKRESRAWLNSYPIEIDDFLYSYFSNGFFEYTELFFALFII